MNAASKLTAMIPARRGSTRLKQKNLALLNGRPLISYAIDIAKNAGIFDRIVVNSEDDVFRDIAAKHGVEFYKRPTELATSDAKSDDVINDFILNNPCDVLAWVNPTSPLQLPQEIKEAFAMFQDQQLDSLVTVRNEQVHAVYQGGALNFNPHEMFARTQDLQPVGLFVYSVMFWRALTFLSSYKKDGFAMLCGKTGYFPVGRLAAVIIKKEEDLRFAQYLLAGMQACQNYTLEYKS